ncbi:DUF6223 family protein [Dactylosporangium sp. NPDC049525]|uniref:DUF6223 family protein n=1 Tax=Dactylosporangium sp. NPDC049525 TaxID=3154730 RepID=UPI0034273D18
MSVLHLLAAPSTSATLAAGYELGHGRFVPSAAAVIGLAGVVIGAMALARPGHGATRARAIAALVAGLLSVAVGGVHGANAAGGLGTGNGLAGAIMAVALGLISMTVAGLALARSRRHA